MSQPIAQSLSNEAISLLEEFVVENDDLLDLEQYIGAFNIFDALGIAHAELKHSNFLAFLLDPAESHGQGQMFLKALLFDLFMKAKGLRPISPIEIDGIDLRGVDVRREWKSIDLLILCEEPRFVVVVENKIHSAEHSDQLQRYQEIVQRSFGDTPALFVFLTLNGKSASQPNWVPYGYDRLHYVFSRVRKTHDSSIGSEVGTFLDHYLNLLSTRFMNDEKIDELCRRIYKTHRKALQLIWERVGNPAAGVVVEVAQLIEDDVNWKILWKTPTYVDCVPTQWLTWLPTFQSSVSYPFCVDIKLNEAELVFILFVGPMQDDAMREQIVSGLRALVPQHGLKVSVGSKSKGKWNRITAKEQILTWEEGSTPSSEQVEIAVKKFLASILTKLQSMEPAVRAMFSASKPNH